MTAQRPRADFSTTVCRDGITVDIHIYRDHSATKWTLEVVHAGQTTTIWEQPFESIREALDAFIAAASQSGMASFTGHDDADTIH